MLVRTCISETDMADDKNNRRFQDRVHESACLRITKFAIGLRRSA